MNNVANILEKVVNGQKLEAHEKAVLTYTTLVLKDYKISTNADLTAALQ